MIDLAPGHKAGLVLDSPVMVAGGTVAYGDALPPGWDLSALGALVVGPVTRHPRSGPAPPRLADVPGGLVLDRGLQNRGVRRVMSRYAGLWERLGLPILVQIGDTDPREAGSTARSVVASSAVIGLELLLDPGAPPEADRALVRALREAVEVPLLAKLPLHAPPERAQALVEAGVDCLVVGRPPQAAARTPQGLFLRGELYGPAVFPLMLHALERLAAAGLGVPLVACGGIHTGDQIRDVLALGAAAVQLDSLVWVEPGMAMELVMELVENLSPGNGARGRG